MTRPIHIWNTKYALTVGITTHDAYVCERNISMVFIGERGRMSSFYLHGEGNEWHRTKESAIAKAEEMRAEKILSLQKQIDKLNKTEFK